MTAIACPEFGHKQFFQTTVGVSEEACSVEKETASTLDNIRDTISYTPRRVYVVNQLLSIHKESSISGWDGYDAQPVKVESLNNAIDFMNDLDEDIPAPDICPEPDGEIALEWYGSNQSTISISIGDSDLISYAAIFPNSLKANGTESLSNEDKGILEIYIKRVITPS